MSNLVKLGKLAFSENSQRAFSENSQRAFSLYKDSENTSIEYSPDPEREDAKSREAGKPLIAEEPPSTVPLEAPLNTLNRAIHQQTKESTMKDILGENQSNITHPLRVDPNPLDEKEGSAAACSTPPDKLMAKRRVSKTSPAAQDAYQRQRDALKLEAENYQPMFKNLHKLCPIERRY